MFRIGHGYDVHRFEKGRKLILCGEEIEHDEGLLGHSDADVAVHALMDAMLGAAALGDIGKHFPDTDDAYKGISSIELLKHVKGLLDGQGMTLSNADITVIAERPKLKAHIDAMRANLADALDVDVSFISVKATTEEGLGIAGKGIAAHAVVIIMHNS
ncbi:MAG: 2-C-methyl-D-erythritol 2,4-cyclodiphosphate synthase [Eubacterium sp.]|nr:2-C-methyl-D-erythritol 2,4-cyclodiphosphate synthase [Eubacterium sp.]